MGDINNFSSHYSGIKMPRSMKIGASANGPSHLGGYLLFAAAIQFILAMIIVQFAYPCHNGVCYNLLTNSISDLGNTQSSALWPLFNYSLVFFGVLSFSGLLLLRFRFPRGALGVVGVIALLIGLLGAIGVGVVPENTVPSLHSIFALMAFSMSGLGILILGLAAKHEKTPGRFSPFSIVLGAFTLIALMVVFFPSFGLIHSWHTFGTGFGFGGIERLVALPPILWILNLGILLLKKEVKSNRIPNAIIIEF